jgi:hypothetical protein
MFEKKLHLIIQQSFIFVKNQYFYFLIFIKHFYGYTYRIVYAIIYLIEINSKNLKSIMIITNLF